MKAALIAGTLDVVIGSGVLTPADLRDIEDNQAATHSVHKGPRRPAPRRRAGATRSSTQLTQRSAHATRRPTCTNDCRPGLRGEVGRSWSNSTGITDGRGGAPGSMGAANLTDLSQNGYGLATDEFPSGFCHSAP